MTQNGHNNSSKMVKMCGVYKNTRKADGATYFSGRLSFSSKLLLLPNPDKKAPNDGQPDYNVLIVEEDVKPKGGSA